MSVPNNRAIFFDRDGILNALNYYADTDEWESPRNAADLQVNSDAPSVLKALQDQGWQIFVVSNQPSYAKGKTSLEDLKAVHASLEETYKAAGVRFTDVYYCYHHPKGIVPEYTGVCDCRKPGIGSLLKAKSAYSLDLTACWFVGDQDTDIACGQRAGCKTILVEYEPSKNKRGHSKPDATCFTLDEVFSILEGALSQEKLRNER